METVEGLRFFELVVFYYNFIFCSISRRVSVYIKKQVLEREGEKEPLQERERKHERELECQQVMETVEGFRFLELCIF